MWQHRRRIMGPGALDPQTKEWLAWATVVMNNSKFAVDIHTSRLKAMGYDSAAIVEALSVINFFVGISTMINGMGGVDLNPEVVAQLEASK
jgi:AhpD family alkylhydroperoxidase